MRPTHLARTAYHEAGHAVLAYVGGLKVLGTSIEEDGDSYGRTFYAYVAEWLKADRLADSQARRRLEACVLCYLAGVEAEARFAGRRDWRGASVDLEDAVSFAEHVVLSDEELRAYLRWLGVRVKGLVTVYWALIDGVARRLLERRNMTARDVQRTIRTLAHARRNRGALVLGGRALVTRAAARGAGKKRKRARS